jgi:hypothetical protein
MSEKVELAAMAAHIERLCEQNEIAVGFIRRSIRAQAATDLRLIQIAPIRSAISYATALHEIGHILGPLQWAGVIKREEGAWRWAERNALIWTEAMEQHRQHAMAWYRREAKKRGDKNAGRRLFRVGSTDLVAKTAEAASSAAVRRAEGNALTDKEGTLRMMASGRWAVLSSWPVASRGHERRIVSRRGRWRQKAAAHAHGISA